MVNRRAIAKQFAAQIVKERDDIVAILLQGSVTRGEHTPSSDVDIGLYLNEQSSDQTHDAPFWEQGVYVECHWVKIDDRYSSLENTMGHPVVAAHLNEAEILYDPSGRFGSLQREVRSEYMDTKWLSMRLKAAIDLCWQYLPELEKSVTEPDIRRMRTALFWLSHAGGSIPLYMAGITPSSTRLLVQLAELNPSLHEKICRLVCPATLDRKDALAAVDLIRSYLELQGPEVAELRGRYVPQKTSYLIDDGRIREAIYVLWFAMRGQPPAPEDQDRADALLVEFVQTIGWSGQDTRSKQALLAEEIVNDLSSIVESAQANVSE